MQLLHCLCSLLPKTMLEIAIYRNKLSFSPVLILCNLYVSEIAEKDNLCLYGHPDENWQVDLPADEVPPELPEPALGINFARDGMKRSDWLALVAVHSDAWLLAVSFYFGARCGFDKESRYQLFVKGSMASSTVQNVKVVTL